jgi:hypothetical protein
MRAWSRGALLVGSAACALLLACGAGAGSKGKPANAASSDAPSSEDGLARGSSDGPPAAEPSPAPMPAVSTGAMPPATPKKAGCLDSTRGAKHTFVGKLEKHPDGSGAVRVKLAKKVCFSGGRFSAGDTDEVILDIDDARARPLLAKKVKVSGTSQDFAQLTQHAYVMRLEVTSLVAAK